MAKLQEVQNMFPSSRIVDLTREIVPGAPVYPGDPFCEFTAHDTIAASGYNLTRVCFGTHQGTHLDAPSHFYENGRTVDRIDLGRCVGPATLIDLGERGAGAKIILADFLPFESAIRPGARVIYRTGWDRVTGSAYFEDYPSLSPELAEWLADRKIALLGMDTPGPAAAQWKEVHQAVLAAEIVVVESLTNLAALGAAEFFLVAAPLKLRGLDGSPIRAFGIVGDRA
ncbi:MAG TPA: cyclase family protein [Chloroflexota bacterium]|nr:cyclase family protein [Chloroflexota bacterium]